jgi:large subunit ribosomal protein L28
MEKSDITEEINRLDHHTGEFQSWLGSKNAIGRKLDFLSQELQREVNTLGAKSSLLEITQLVVLAKATIEKLREQVQNVE